MSDPHAVDPYDVQGLLSALAWARPELAPVLAVSMDAHAAAEEFRPAAYWRRAGE